MAVVARALGRKRFASPSGGRLPVGQDFTTIAGDGSPEQRRVDARAEGPDAAVEEQCRQAAFKRRLRHAAPSRLEFRPHLKRLPRHRGARDDLAINSCSHRIHLAPKTAVGECGPAARRVPPWDSGLDIPVVSCDRVFQIEGPIDFRLERKRVTFRRRNRLADPIGEAVRQTRSGFLRGHVQPITASAFDRGQIDLVRSGEYTFRVIGRVTRADEYLEDTIR